MSDMAREAVENITKGFTDDEVAVVLRNISDDALWAEIRRRYDQNKKLINDTRNFVGQLIDETL